MATFDIDSRRSGGSESSALCTHSSKSSSDMCEHPGERPRDPAEVERLDEQARVPDLPVSQPTVQLRFDRLVAVLDLLLERLEPRKIALLLGNLQHDNGAVGADELVLEVDLADVEAEALHVRARQTRP